MLVLATLLTDSTAHEQKQHKPDTGREESLAVSCDEMQSREHADGTGLQGQEGWKAGRPEAARARQRSTSMRKRMTQRRECHGDLHRITVPRQGNTSKMERTMATSQQSAHLGGARSSVSVAAGDGATPRSVGAAVEALYHACATISGSLRDAMRLLSGSLWHMAHDANRCDVSHRSWRIRCSHKSTSSSSPEGGRTRVRRTPGRNFGRS